MLTVVPPVFLPTYSYYVLTSRSITDCQKELETNFRRVLQNAQSYLENNKPDLKISIKLSSGLPHEEILKTAKQGNFDLIIMGSKGSGASNFFQGSISSRVIEEAPCPVLVIKQTFIRSTIMKPALMRRSKKMLANLNA